MRKFLAVCVVLSLAVGSAAAQDDGKQYVLRNGQVTLEALARDVDQIKQDHKAMMARLDRIEAKLDGRAGGPVVNPNWNKDATPAAAPAQEYEYRQVCEVVNGQQTCRIVKVPKATQASGGLTKPTAGPTCIPPCGCGCMETGQCRCKNCAERTADPTWSPVSTTAAAPSFCYDVGGCNPWMNQSRPAVAYSYPTATPPRAVGWGNYDPSQGWVQFGSSYPVTYGGVVGAGDTVCVGGTCYSTSGTSSGWGGGTRSGPLRRLFGR